MPRADFWGISHQLGDSARRYAFLGQMTAEGVPEIQADLELACPVVDFTPIARRILHGIADRFDFGKTIQLFV